MGKKEKAENNNLESVSIVDLNPLPEGGWGWLVCLAGFTAQFLILGIQNNTGILYTALLTEFKGRKGDTGRIYHLSFNILEEICLQQVQHLYGCQNRDRISLVG